MPRLIDHAQRDREIGDAALRVLAREGLVGLSVRKVADEAGLATASLRRAFPTQEALRQFCLDRIRADVSSRIQALTGEGTALALAFLRELLPLDEIRRVELTVQLQLGSLALTDPSLADGVRELHTGVRAVCAAVLNELDRHSLLQPATDLGLESSRLHGLLDGLALHMLWTPSQSTEHSVMAALAHHLHTLTDGRPGSAPPTTAALQD